MGLFAKRLKKYLKNITSKIGEYDCFFVVNQHAYMNQEVTNGEGTIIPSGGKGQIFIPSITLKFSKLKLKEGSDIVGIRLRAETEKTRFFQLGAKTELNVPYTTGIDPLDGVLELMEDYYPEVLGKNGAWYNYVNDDGDTVKFQSKDFKDHADFLLAKVDKTEITENFDTIEEEMPEEGDQD